MTALIGISSHIPVELQQAWAEWSVRRRHEPMSLLLSILGPKIYFGGSNMMDFSGIHGAITNPFNGN